MKIQLVLLCLAQFFSNMAMESEISDNLLSSEQNDKNTEQEDCKWFVEEIQYQTLEYIASKNVEKPAKTLEILPEVKWLVMNTSVCFADIRTNNDFNKKAKYQNYKRACRKFGLEHKKLTPLQFAAAIKAPQEIGNMLVENLLSSAPSKN